MGLIVVTAMLLPFILPGAVALASPHLVFQNMQQAVSPELDLIGLNIERATFESNTWRLETQDLPLHLRVIWLVRQSAKERPIAWRLCDKVRQVCVENTQLPRYGTAVLDLTLFATPFVPPSMS